MEVLFCDFYVRNGSIGVVVRWHGHYFVCMGCVHVHVVEAVVVVRLQVKVVPEEFIQVSASVHEGVGEGESGMEY